MFSISLADDEGDLTLFSISLADDEGDLTLFYISLADDEDVLTLFYISLVDDEDDLTKFFSTVVTFIKAPYTSSVINNVDVLSVSEIYVPVWDSIYQLWYLCIQGIVQCNPSLPITSSFTAVVMDTFF